MYSFINELKKKKKMLSAFFLFEDGKGDQVQIC